jgi:F-type H+-transporting ATPase subunit b
MPQFDLTTYSSQIFWLILCFIALYLFFAFIIIPRIAGIIGEREQIIEGNKNYAEKINSQIKQLKLDVDKIKKDASNFYQNQIDSALSSSGKIRDEMKFKLKSQIVELNKQTKLEIANFININKEEKAQSSYFLLQAIKEKLSIKN